LSEVKRIPLESITVPAVRASSKMTPEQLEFFKTTIDKVGVVQDPVVRALGEGKFELVAGLSRIREMQLKGETAILCKVLQTDEKTSLVMHLAENVARGSVDVISIGKVMERLKELGSSIPEISGILGKSESWVRRTLSLLELPEVYQDALKDGRLTPTHVFLAAKMPTSFEMDDALQTALRLGWNTSIFETYVNNRLAEIEAAKKAALEKGIEPEIPTAEPQQLISYKQCLLCGYRKPAETVTVNMVCDGCEKLVKYLTSQLGPPEKAIEDVYAALSAYFGQAPPQTSTGPRQGAGSVQP